MTAVLDVATDIPQIHEQGMLGVCRRLLGVADLERHDTLNTGGERGVPRG